MKTIKTVINVPMTDDALIANTKVAKLVKQLDEIKQQARTIKMVEDNLKLEIQEFMGDSEKLFDLKGNLIVTWIQGKPVTKLDTKMLEAQYPKVYNACLVEANGNRVFLVK